MGNTISAMIGANASAPIQEPQVDDGWSKSKRKRKRRQERKRAKLAVDEQARLLSSQRQSSKADLLSAHRQLATDTPQSAEEHMDSKPFPFFQLPRELRDDIYGRLAQERHIYKLHKGFTCFDKGAFQVGAAARIGLVSKQFKQEYEEELSRQSEYRTLNLHALGLGRYGELDALKSMIEYEVETDWLSRPTSLQRQFSRVTRVHLIFDHDAHDLDFRKARPELQALLYHMPLLKTVEIEARDICLGWSAKVNDLHIRYLQEDSIRQLRDFLLRDDAGEMIGGFDVEYSVALGCAMHSALFQTHDHDKMVDLLEESWPEFTSWVKRRKDRILVAQHLSAVHISHRTKILGDHDPELRVVASEMRASLGSLQADVMTGLQQLQDSGSWRGDFHKMWNEVNDRYIADQPFRMSHVYDERAVRRLCP